MYEFLGIFLHRESSLQICRWPLPPARSGSAAGKFWVS
ncbi:hypothetical protein SLEP1_g10918 [Rubroshorea leprosula]|uniref:Uncharacterized protein n=1 Tax=Rubroshorea leprosula TaxID=152421 RepID=A0AAV5IFF6_9ROSI|nr:hypothetical protein SLEP1_g10918 [Rubroshorea leprosula]